MTKMPKIATTFFITILYCFILGIYGSGIVSSNSVYTAAVSNKNQVSISVVSTNVLCHIGTSENSISGYHNLPTSSPKERLTTVSACSRAIAIRAAHTISIYSFFSKNLIHRLNRTDIIFPSHYFW